MRKNVVQCRDLVPYYNDDSTTETCSIPDIVMQLRDDPAQSDDSVSSSKANVPADASVSSVDSSNEEDAMLPAESRPSGQVLMQANNPPTLRCTDTKDIIRFLRKYALYRQNIDDANADSVVKMTPRSVKSMFEPVLFSALMKYEWKTMSPNISDEVLLRWLKKQQGSDTSSQHALSKIMRDNLKMDMKIVASAARVHDLQRQVEKLSSENNWGGLFSTPGGKKNLVRFLLEAVQPSSFRNYMKNVVNVSMPELQQDSSKFFEVLKNKTKIFDEMNNMGHEMGIRDSNSPKRKHGGADRKGNNKKSKTERPSVKCLKCGQQGHFMSKCPQKPSKEEQDLLMKKHRAQLSVQKSSDNKSKKSTYVFVNRIESSQYAMARSL
jgi:hypothetical protein